ncbi:hypothetical protein R3P38DRAFT_1040541 [Favolaschia claudopus]|uniref:Protein kinase domain-containing protein n=1 Tax=Favolaschia claudopus TaxID=2862362 RepID=A0AAW0BJT6_9AGAR
MAFSFRDYPPQDTEVEDIPSPSVAQALFHKNQNFEISGGTFNFTVQRKEPEFENFRRIRLGDIVLQKDIGSPGRRGYNGNVVRRVYAARIVGMESPMTVAIYEGPEKDISEKWDKYMSQQTRLRHPNTLQLFGITSSQGLYAAILHDEYISYDQMANVYSTTLTHRIYLWHFSDTEFKAHGPYIAFMINSPKGLKSLSHTRWFHPSGKLCIELHPSRGIIDLYIRFTDPTATIRPTKCLIPPGEVSQIIDSMDLESYYFQLDVKPYLCQTRRISLDRNSTVRPYSVVKHVAGSLQEIAYLPQVTSGEPRWEHNYSSSVVHIMPNGWTRVFHGGNEIPGAKLFFNSEVWVGKQRRPWYAQSNYIFGCMCRPQCFSCSYIECTRAECKPISSIPPSLKKPFLYLPPARAFFTPDLTRICYPDLTARPYWCFDPSGKDHLSSQEALDLGLPPIQLKILVDHIFMEDSEEIIKDIHRFHTRKGFNPKSQDVAKHLGLQLYCFGEEEDPAPSPLYGPNSPGDFFDVDYPVFGWEWTDDEEDHESDDEQILYPRIAPNSQGRGFEGGGEGGGR